MTTDTSEGAQPRVPARWLVGVGFAGAVALLFGSSLAGPGSATGHAQFHGLFALGALIPAGLLVATAKRPTLASLAPVLALWLLAATQLVEGVGALGYGADGYSRVNGLVVLHDIGLALTPIGLIGTAIGVAARIGSLVGQRFGRPRLAAGVTAVVGLVAVVGVAKMIGL